MKIVRTHCGMALCLIRMAENEARTGRKAIFISKEASLGRMRDFTIAGGQPVPGGEESGPESVGSQ